MRRRVVSHGHFARDVENHECELHDAFDEKLEAADKEREAATA